MYQGPRLKTGYTVLLGLSCLMSNDPVSNKGDHVLLQNDDTLSARYPNPQWTIEYSFLSILNELGLNFLQELWLTQIKPRSIASDVNLLKFREFETNYVWIFGHFFTT